MLNPATANSLARGHVRRRTLLKPGLALRFVLTLAALAYVMGPTVVQWVSFETVRTEVAAIREATPPAVLEVPDRVSAEVQTLLENVAPENVRGLVGPGLSALGTVHESAGGMGATIIATGMRAAQMAMIALTAVAIAFRSTLRYQPRHGTGWVSVLLGRKG